MDELPCLKGIPMGELSHRETLMVVEQGPSIIRRYFRRIALGHGERQSGDIVNRGQQSILS